MSQSIADIRINYSRKSLSEKDIDLAPMVQFQTWWTEAVNAQLLEVNAMTLATCSADGLPAARIVLLKGLSEKGFIFFTNYNSYKGMQLAENPKACLVFFWKELERQVRVTGLVEKVTEQESDKYFYSRPEGSQIGAAISPQSTVIESREWLEERLIQFKGPVKRPIHWGGYLVKPVVMEFWQGRPSRLHDRIQYSLADSGEWRIDRLAP
jgi:pyridoxamine 5'-phosphate oxidase